MALHKKTKKSKIQEKNKAGRYMQALLKVHKTLQNTEYMSPTWQWCNCDPAENKENFMKNILKHCGNLRDLGFATRVRVIAKALKLGITLVLTMLLIVARDIVKIIKKYIIFLCNHIWYWFYGGIYHV